jgi:cation diffusion facilitator CzcD-associated flavoprotein CzcO
MAETTEFDVAIIGGGQGGGNAARYLAAEGLKNPSPAKWSLNLCAARV